MLGSGATQRWFWVVQGVSLARVVLVFGFVVACPFRQLSTPAFIMYACAGLTDFFDGRLARAKAVSTRFGGALDVFGDRYFSVISCLYVGFRGVSMIPLSIILLRELYSVALRMVQIDGKGVMVQNRLLGGIFHTLIGLGTLGFIASPVSAPSQWFSLPFYLAAFFYLFYLPYSINQSRRRIWASITADLNEAWDRASRES